MQTATTLMAANYHSTTLQSDHGNHHDQDAAQIRCKEERRRVTDFQWARLRPPPYCTPYGRYATRKHRQTHPACACQPDMRFNYITGARTHHSSRYSMTLAHHFRYWFQFVFTQDNESYEIRDLNTVSVKNNDTTHTITPHHATAEKS
jgi:hypothetical protein